MDLVIGAPVFERAWVLDEWFQHLARQNLPGSVRGQDVTVLLNDGGSRDGTLDIIEQWDQKTPWAIEVIDSSGVGGHQGERKWSKDRYSLMADLRNQLLARVRELGPAYYWSIDTDILAPPGTLTGLIRGQWRFNGTAPTVYMTKHSTLYPNMMRLQGRRARGGPRVIPAVPQGENFARVDVAFACVLMDADLYAIDYEAHDQGEDIGWGLRAREAGLTMGIHVDCRCKHAMEPGRVDTVDPRVGF